ncbi:SHOCT domain-containing protein [Thioclava atlantica]|uniref:Membrane protein-like protein n=1 Tax=Thioclava atlantica TaxID=1317124 RepID=A0A085U0N8_9RHOB|nr:SHOCT domain-containing protein [Thioclava atlantica]KFE36535.1 Membrane protein-like protein [Thioclava atlantica]
MTRLPFYTTLLSTLSAGTAWADAPSGGYGGGYYGHPMMWGEGYGFFGVGMMMIFWGVLIVLAVLAVRWLMEQRGGAQGKTDALDILKERLAKGEIDPEEYQARRKALEE